MSTEPTIGIRRSTLTLAACALLAAGSGVGVSAQAAPEPPASEARRITATWTETPIRDVLLAFAFYSGKSIVPGAGVTGSVTASIVDRPWDVALQSILTAHGLVAVENEYGIISVDDIANLNAREAIEPVVTRSYRISFVRASEIQAALAPLLSERGSISVSESTNTVIVTDIARVHRAIGGVLRAP